MCRYRCTSFCLVPVHYFLLVLSSISPIPSSSHLLTPLPSEMLREGDELLEVNGVPVMGRLTDEIVRLMVRRREEGGGEGGEGRERGEGGKGRKIGVGGRGRKEGREGKEGERGEGGKERGGDEYPAHVCVYISLLCSLTC